MKNLVVSVFLVVAVAAGCGNDTPTGPSALERIKGDIEGLSGGSLLHLYQSLLIEVLAGSSTTSLLTSLLVGSDVALLPEPTEREVARADEVKEKILARPEGEFGELFSVVTLEFTNLILTVSSQREEPTPTDPPDPPDSLTEIVSAITALSDAALFHLYSSMLIDLLSIPPENVGLLDLLITGGDTPSDSERADSVRVKALIDALGDRDISFMFSVIVLEFSRRIISG